MKAEAVFFAFLCRLLEVGLQDSRPAKVIPAVEVPISSPCECECSCSNGFNSAWVLLAVLGLASTCLQVGVIAFCSRSSVEKAAYHGSPRRKGRGVIVMPSKTRLLIWYADDTMWHERILVWKASETSWYIVTPDFDVYEESYTLSGEGPSRFKVKGVHVQYYSRLHAPVYQFAEAPSQRGDERLH